MGPAELPVPSTLSAPLFCDPPPPDLTAPGVPRAASLVLSVHDRWWTGGAIPSQAGGELQGVIGKGRC